jgi:peptidoglycan/LPS O-acetylase OafA/YrhL
VGGHPTDLQRFDRGRIASLDGLRALAVMLVLGDHACHTYGFHYPRLQGILENGSIGVEIFFVISGFLITNLMLREIDRTRQFSIKSFYYRRALRILPAYVTYLLVVAMLQRVGAVNMHAGDWSGAAFYTINFHRHRAWETGHFWSLSIEEHFYLLWPLVMAFASRRTARHVAVIMIFGCFVGRWLVLMFFPAFTPMEELWTITRLDTIAFGCMLALLSWEKPARQRLDALCRKPVLSAGAIFALVLSVIVIGPRSTIYRVGLGYTLNAALLSLLLWSAIRQSESAVGKLLNMRLMTMIGAGSYSIYLWQQIFLPVGHRAWYTTFPLNLLIAGAVAAISYWLVEKPFLRLRYVAAKKSRCHTPAEPDSTPISCAVPAF